MPERQVIKRKTTQTARPRKNGAGLKLQGGGIRLQGGQCGDGFFQDVGKWFKGAEKKLRPITKPVFKDILLPVLGKALEAKLLKGKGAPKKKRPMAKRR